MEMNDSLLKHFYRNFNLTFNDVKSILMVPSPVYIKYTVVIFEREYKNDHYTATTMAPNLCFFTKI